MKTELQKNLPIGVSDFKSWLIQQEIICLLIKAYLSKAVLDDKSEAVLITRPRRWGKTLNLSMLEYFLSANDSLFDDLSIAKVGGGSYMAYRGRSPVVFVSFKDVKESKLSSAIQEMGVLFQTIFRKYQKDLLESVELTKFDKGIVEKYLSGNLQRSDIRNALFLLSDLLHKHYGEKVYILIDEYDTPLNYASIHGYLDEMTEFVKNLLSVALKDNSHLEKGVMTGILKISKDSMLSGLNNLNVFSILSDTRYDAYFGFSESEVKSLFSECCIKYTKMMRRYYNGYRVHDKLLYNPWSIVACLEKQGEVKPYWVNTSDDRLLKETLLNSTALVKQQLEQLISDNQYILRALISEATRFEHIRWGENALWGLMLSAGYLTFKSKKVSGIKYQCELIIPNQEVRSLYTDIFKGWLMEKLDNSTYYTFLEDLTSGRITEFTQRLSKYLLTQGSFHDFKDESNYHTFLLGLLCSLSDDYWIYSNTEAGFGRADLILVPKDTAKSFAIIIELKHEKKAKPSKKLAIAALKQIDTQQYAAFYCAAPRHIEKTLKMGLVFNGKQVNSCYRWDDCDDNPLTEAVCDFEQQVSDSE